MNTLRRLPIRERIIFQNMHVCLQMHCWKRTKILIGFHLAQTPVTGPITRSSNDSTLIGAHVGRNCIGDKSFYVTAPRSWNALPHEKHPGGKITDCVQKDVEVSPLSEKLAYFVFLFALFSTFTL